MMEARRGPLSNLALLLTWLAVVSWVVVPRFSYRDDGSRITEHLYRTAWTEGHAFRPDGPSSRLVLVGAGIALVIGLAGLLGGFFPAADRFPDDEA